MSSLGHVEAARLMHCDQIPEVLTVVDLTTAVGDNWSMDLIAGD